VGVGDLSQVKEPTLIILGEKDDIRIHNGSKQVLESLATKDKAIQAFQDADHFFYHTFLFGKTTAKHDPAKRKQVTTVVKDWLNSH